MKGGEMKPLKILLIVFCAVSISTVCYFALRHFYLPKKDWRVIKGCVSENNEEIDYQFYGKNNWSSVTPNMGCGKDYTNVESFGIKDYSTGQDTINLTQITVTIQKAKPDSYDNNIFEYYKAKDSDLYLEIGRITSVINNEVNLLSDSEWKYLKNSVKVY